MPTVRRHSMRALLVGLGIAIAVWTVGAATLCFVWHFVKPQLVVIK